MSKSVAAAIIARDNCLDVIKSDLRAMDCDRDEAKIDLGTYEHVAVSDAFESSQLHNSLSMLVAIGVALVNSLACRLSLDRGFHAGVSRPCRMSEFTPDKGSVLTL